MRRQKNRSPSGPIILEEERDAERLVLYLRDHGVTKGSVIGMELDVLPVTAGGSGEDRMPDWTIEDVTPLILGQRQIKDGAEIESIRRACRVMDLGHDRIRATLKAGMTELSISVLSLICRCPRINGVTSSRSQFGIRLRHCRVVTGRTSNSMPMMEPLATPWSHRYWTSRSTSRSASS